MSVATLKAESKEIIRRPIGKVVVTWTDPLIDLSIDATPTENNYISYPIQVADEITDVPVKWFHTNDTDVVLDGTFYPMPSTLLEARKYQVGWWGTQSSDSSGNFVTPVSLSLTFASRAVYGFTIAGDNALNEYPVDFTVQVQIKVGTNYITTEIVTITGNTDLVFSQSFSNSHINTDRLVLNITKWSTPGKIVKITEFYSSVVETFENDQILYMNILQEFESSDGTLPVGNISCNEVDLKLQNLDDRFFAGNTDSNIHTFIKRNRKIEPYLGFQYENGTKEYLPMGLYWSGDWVVGDLDTGAQTSARDRFELFRTRDFDYESVFPDILYNVSLKSLLTTVLDSLYDYMYDFFYDISDLDDVYIVPVFQPEFFKKKTYFDVIKELTAASLAYAYMDQPTDDEITENGLLNKDMLRVKKFLTVFPNDVIDEDAEDFEQSDYIEKTQPANTENLANTINVTYKEFTEKEVDEGEEKEFEDEEFIYTAKDDASIVDYGSLSYDYTSSDLIQTEAHAQDIANILLESFKVLKRDIEIQTFGDLTRNLADIISVPDYFKNGIETRGIFAITKLNRQYDGSLRSTVSGRKIEDDTPLVVYQLVQDTDGATTKWQDNDVATTTELYQDAGV